MTHGGIGSGDVSLQVHDGEAKIYGRLTKSKLEGVFSNAGLLGRCFDREDQAVTMWSSADLQKFYYISGKCPRYYPYKSQSGFQAMVYFLLSQFSEDPFIFQSFCAAFLAIVLTLWLIWLSGRFGLGSTFFVFVGILSLRGLIVLGNNIGQVFGATYLIMVAVFWAYEKNIKHIEWAVFSVMLLKFLFNGAEYLFDALLLPFLPLVFYAVLNRMSFSRVLQDAALIVKGELWACYAAFLILLIQLNASGDSFLEAARHFTERFLARTYPSTANLLPYYVPLIRKSAIQLWGEYLNFGAVNIGQLKVSFGYLILFFAFISSLALLACRRNPLSLLRALLITTWVSILCPAAWIVIAKGHAATHPFIDPIVWHIPFTLFGIALTYVTVQNLFFMGISVKKG